MRKTLMVGIAVSLLTSSFGFAAQSLDKQALFNDVQDRMLIYQLQTLSLLEAADLNDRSGVLHELSRVDQRIETQNQSSVTLAKYSLSSAGVLAFGALMTVLMPAKSSIPAAVGPNAFAVGLSSFSAASSVTFVTHENETKIDEARARLNTAVELAFESDLNKEIFETEQLYFLNEDPLYVDNRESYIDAFKNSLYMEAVERLKSKSSLEDLNRHTYAGFLSGLRNYKGEAVISSEKIQALKVIYDSLKKQPASTYQMDTAKMLKTGENISVVLQELLKNASGDQKILLEKMNQRVQKEIAILKMM